MATPELSSRDITLESLGYISPEEQNYLDNTPGATPYGIYLTRRRKGIENPLGMDNPNSELDLFLPSSYTPSGNANPVANLNANGVVLDQQLGLDKLDTSGLYDWRSNDLATNFPNMGRIGYSPETDPLLMSMNGQPATQNPITTSGGANPGGILDPEPTVQPTNPVVDSNTGQTVAGTVGTNTVKTPIAENISLNPVSTVPVKSNVNLQGLQQNGINGLYDNGATGVQAVADQAAANSDEWNNNSNDPKKMLLPLPNSYEYDMPSTAYMLGRGIYNASSGNGSLGNTLTGIAAPALKFIASGAKSFLGGYTTAKMSNNIRRNAQQRRANALEDNFSNFAEGGMFEEDVYPYSGTAEEGVDLTGEFAPTLNKATAGNANVYAEDGEYVIQTDGSTQEIEGDRHRLDKNGEVVEETGTPMEAQNGAAFISDRLPIGQDLAKRIRQEYGLSVKASDTYANALDKYKKKIGLEKAYEEQQKWIDKIEKNNSLKDENTRELNKEVYSGKINDTEKEIEPLESDFNSFSYMLFDEQEGNKQNEAQNSYFKNGGRHFDDKSVKAFADKIGTSVEEARSIIYKNRNLYPMYADGGLFFDVYDNSSRGQYNNTFGHQSSTGNGYGDVNSNTRTARLDELARLFPRLVNGSSPILQKNANGNYDFVDGKTTKDLQRRVQAVYDSTKKLSGNVGNKDQFLQFFEDNGFVDQEGNVRNFDDMLGNFTSTRPSVRMRAVTDDQLKKLNDKGIYNLSEIIGNDEAKSILGDDYDRLIGYAPEGDFTDFYLASYKPEDKGNTETKVDNKTGDVVVDKEKEKDTTTNTGKATNKFDPSKYMKEGRYRQYMMPDRYIAPPEELGLPRLIQVGNTPVEAMQLDIPYQEIYDAGETALRSLDGVPDSQKSAVAGSIAATTTDAINKAYGAIAPKNVESRLQADTYNAQSADNTERVNASLLGNYDALVGTAEAKTTEEIRNYYDALSEQQIGNFNTENTLNLLSDLYSSYGIDESGKVRYEGSGLNMAVNPMDALTFYRLQNEKQQQERYEGRKGTSGSKSKS